MGFSLSQFARRSAAALALAALSVATPLAAQSAGQGIETIDPDTMIDGDLAGPDTAATDGPDAPIVAARPVYPADAPEGAEYRDPNSAYSDDPYADSAVSDNGDEGGVAAWTGEDFAEPASPSDAATRAATQPADDDSTTYASDDLIGAAEGVFGEGAEGVARLIEDLLSEQGEPNGYIVGREGGGAFIVGVRYGSGTLFHKVEGQRKVYWTGPSIGFDAGANAGSTFVLVYNLFDTQDLFRRFPAGEGQAYLVGGLSVSYVRRGDIVLIPIRAGAGLRAGVNAGYLRFSEKQRWLPF